MYVVSRYGGWGRNLWACLDNGTITIDDKKRHIRLKVSGSLVVEQITQIDDEQTTMKYGRHRKTRKGNKTIKEEYFEPGTLRAIRRSGLWKKETGVPLCGSEGTLECYSTSGGAYAKEVFKYANGNVAYVATRWRKSLEIRYPNGKPWIIMKGQVALHWESIAGRLGSDKEELHQEHLMRGPNWEITVYDPSGSEVITHGCVQSRQKQGKWLENGREHFYLSGVKVSRQLYEEDPNKWKPHEVLRIPNAQLRCSLLNRMGYDRLLDKVEHRVIDQAEDGGQLVEIDAAISDHSAFRPDRTMRLLKVICPSTQQVYVLRVPPEAKTYDNARQWTFGLREREIEQGVRFDLAVET
ncbi:MAG: hypothetical protein JXN61_16135 [Sedimentisphaerales bacterium]|nr:hypothetical protein [Sedimentisphaerales bacterium]